MLVMRRAIVPGICARMNMGRSATQQVPDVAAIEAAIRTIIKQNKIAHGN
jgi:hypothetical protein